MSDSGLICAFDLDGAGGDRLGWDEIRADKPEGRLRWIHLDYEDRHAIKWLSEEANVSKITREALLAHDPRPRALQSGDGLMIVIRGVNGSSEAHPEDMVSLRIWLEADRVISLRHRKYDPARHLRERITKGEGPSRVAELLHQLYDLSLAPITMLVDQLDRDVDALEDEVLSGDEGDIRARLSLVRRQSIALRRHIGPQKATLLDIGKHNLSWMTDIDRLNFGEAAEQQTRIVEELDSARERAAVTAEELAGRLSELMDRRLYVLSMIAAISLPLGILTGLLGVNVGGIPLQANSYGFVLTCALLSGLTVLQIYLFRRLKWL